ncbi:uncharacterized protein [Glycine max]|uniref:uncharacterized protein n=1 Tax=Glycine max TaxID=3847 RepID=UPI0003DEB85E|nr:uncharacterized protein LOC113000707 [Glycine max]|eukprot:XP_025983160.1 uncharacterized protein LOC113000707 [Glycine max]
MSYVDLLPSLIANQIAVVTLRRIYQSPFPRWYNPNATCAYHGGTLGHLIEQCVALKHKVQSLIDAGWLTFQEDDPNVKINPLTNHGGPAVNALEECGPQRPKQLKDVVTSRRFMLEALREAGFISFDGGEGDNCLIHPGEAHNVEACPVVEDLLQGIMDQGQFEISDARKEEQHVCMQSVDKCPSNPKPLVIHFTRDGASQKPRGSQPILGKKPVPFPYRSNKAAPWRYAPQKLNEKKDKVVGDDLSFAKVTNIMGMSGVTRSGRVFAPPDPLVRSKDVKGKVKGEEDFDRKKISAKEANEFPQIIQQSEFKVIEQLNKTLGRVSLLELLMNSKPHQALLVKILNETHVAQDISVEGFGGIINNITANNYLTFVDEEIPVEGRGHNTVLHVSVKCLDHVMAKMLIDSGSSLNVMPKSTLDKLPFNASHLRQSSMVVQAFDGNCRDVRG